MTNPANEAVGRTPEPTDLERRLLKEDADERRMFEMARKLHSGSLESIASALSMWHVMAPTQGSYGKMLAIYANEVAKAAAELATLRAKVGAQASLLAKAGEALEAMAKQFSDYDAPWLTRDDLRLAAAVHAEITESLK